MVSIALPFTKFSNYSKIARAPVNRKSLEPTGIINSTNDFTELDKSRFFCIFGG